MFKFTLVFAALAIAQGIVSIPIAPPNDVTNVAYGPLSGNIARDAVALALLGRGEEAEGENFSGGTPLLGGQSAVEDEAKSGSPAGSGGLLGGLPLVGGLLSGLPIVGGLLGGGGGDGGGGLLGGLLGGLPLVGGLLGGGGGL